MESGEIRLIRSPDTLRKNRVPPGQKLTERFPVLHYGPVPAMDAKRWTFTISGLVDPPRQLTYDEFKKLPRVRVFSDIHCVTTWSRLDNLWEGVSASAIRDLTRILPEAKFVIVHAAPSFTTNLTLDDFFAEDVLLADKYERERLTPDHGYPVRLVVPRLYFWKSTKWVTGIEFTAQDRPGFWESRGYHNHGDPWLEERYG